MPLITVNKTSLHIEGPIINIIICPPLKVVQKLKVLLGRDILSMCTLFYNGVDNTFVLHY
jgi:hypothetical protein